MTAQVATLGAAAGVIGLFAIDRDQNDQTSKALWIPVIWVSIAASRMASQWLAAIGLVPATETMTADQLLEGSPLDRLLLTAFVLFSLMVLFKRARRVVRILTANGPILLYFFYCAVSILWSDYPDVAFKRWIKAVGDLAMILIVLTDRDPHAAVKRLLTRAGFVLTPASILLIKYYPDLGRVYYAHLGTFLNVGVTTGKNELGIICFLFGAASFWRLWQALIGPGDARRTRHLIAHGIVLVATIWLFEMAQSMTSLACFLMASIVIVVTSSGASRLPRVTNFRRSAVTLFSRSVLRVVRAPWVRHVVVVVLLSVAVSVLFLHMGSGLMQSVGRDATLTGRTGVWDTVLSLAGNLLFGTGFESFWLGPRLDKIWSVYWWHPNEAHDGYLEVFLNLGWVGIGLLAFVILAGYRNIVKTFRNDPNTGSLRLAYFVTGIAYNFTESAIRIMHPVWIFFLLATIAVPGGWRQRQTPRAIVVAELTGIEDGSLVFASPGSPSQPGSIDYLSS